LARADALGPDLGAGVPEEIHDAGVGDDYQRALEISRRELGDQIDLSLVQQVEEFTQALGGAAQSVEPPNDDAGDSGPS